MGKKQAFTLNDLTSRGMVEVSPGVFQKASLPQPRDKEKIRVLLKNQLNFKDQVVLIHNETKAFIDKPPFEFYIEFPVDPMGKPRMTQSDKWNKRPVTDRYWQLKDNLKKIAEGMKFTMPSSNYHMIFYLPMPDSWAKSKKSEMNGKPHQQKPDKDNLEKAVLDALCTEDSYVWDGRVTKYWAYKGSIVIKNLE